MEDIQELAMDFMHRNDCNFFASNIIVPLKIFGHDIEVESIWYSDKDDAIYLHCNCEEFSGDLDIDYLSNENQQMLIDIFKAHI